MEKKNGGRKLNSAISGMSMKSVKSTGIHRALSGVSLKDKNNSTSLSASKVFGSSGAAIAAKAANKKQGKMIGLQYKAKKASGDVKRNQKLDPYAYVPLNRKVLKNKSKAEQLAYKSLLKGVKRKISKSYRK